MEYHLFSCKGYQKTVTPSCVQCPSTIFASVLTGNPVLHEPNLLTASLNDLSVLSQCTAVKWAFKNMMRSNRVHAGVSPIKSFSLTRTCFLSLPFLMQCLFLVLLNNHHAQWMSLSILISTEMCHKYKKKKTTETGKWRKDKQRGKYYGRDVNAKEPPEGTGNILISSVHLLHLDGNATDAVENVGFHNQVC